MTEPVTVFWCGSPLRDVEQMCFPDCGDYDTGIGGAVDTPDVVSFICRGVEVATCPAGAATVAR